MAKMIVAFLVLFAAVAGTITLFRSLTVKEKWSVVKLVAYSGGISAIVIVLLGLFVAVF